MEHANVSPFETVICEDSPVGLEAAYRSMAHVIQVSDINDVNYHYVSSALATYNCDDIKKIIIPKRNVNIVIPMAGNGSRFAMAGYDLPKPLIDIVGKPMIQRVIDNMNIKGRYIFIVQKAHYDKVC